MDSRKVRILEAIVHDYVATTRPVGSERLIEVYKLGCKSATVRNEMAEMAEMGYLEQPHTSAGRIPTDQGYRFYVNALMNPPAALSSTEARQAEESLHSEPTEIEEIIIHTCRILSSLTSYPSLATDPVTETTVLRRIFLTEANPRCILMVALLSNGHVEHRLVEIPAPAEENLLVRCANYVNTLVGDAELSEVSARVAGCVIPSELQPQAPLLSRVLSALLQMVASRLERRVFLEGMSQILRQPEFKDVQRLETLLFALEQRSAIYQMLHRAASQCDITILIGSENEFEPMQECSIIMTSYFIGSRCAGYLGVVGPTRMHYDRGVAAVELMAQNLSQMLTNFNLA